MAIWGTSEALVSLFSVSVSLSFTDTPCLSCVSRIYATCVRVPCLGVFSLNAPCFPVRCLSVTGFDDNAFRHQIWCCEILGNDRAKSPRMYLPPLSLRRILTCYPVSTSTCPTNALKWATFNLSMSSRTRWFSPTLYCDQ